LTNETSGYLKVTVSASGAFSGRLSVAGIAYPLTGVFDQNANYEKVIPRKNLSSLDLSLHLDPAADISGTLSDGVNSSVLLANRLTFSATHKALQAGRYTALLSGNSNVPGNGYLLVSVGAGGGVSAAGRLADGTPVSTSGWLNADGGMPYYTGAYQTGTGAGSFFGQLSFQPDAGVQCSGTYAWFHPGSTSYPTGFAQSGGVTGSLIVPPAPAIGTKSAPPDTINAELSGTDIPNPIDETGQLLPSGAVIWSAPGTEDLTLKISTTGQVTGSFIDPATGKRVAILGLWLADQSLGGGYFIGNSPGALTLSQ
jgi:hypothetical protein